MTTTANPPGAMRRPPAPDYLLEPTRYASREFQQLESERLWTRTWQLACLASEVPSVGDYHVYDIGPYSIIIVRSADGSLGAYHNVCQHRGRKIKQGSGNANQITCIYHGWTWDLQGDLKEVPERETYCEFDDATCRLPLVRLEQFHDWVFVNLDPDAPPLLDYLGDVIPLIEPYHIESQFRWKNESTTFAANWKATVEAFVESFHSRSLHVEVTAFVNNTDYEVRFLGDNALFAIDYAVPDRYSMPSGADHEEILEAMDWFVGSIAEDTSTSAMISVFRQMPLAPGQEFVDLFTSVVKMASQAMNIDMSGLTEEQLSQAWTFFIFPNLTVHCHAMGYFIFRYLPDGDDPNRCTFHTWWFSRSAGGTELPPPAELRVLPEGTKTGNPVVDQDIANLPVQQAGLRNPFFKGHRLSSQESIICHFNSVLDRYVYG